MIELHMNLKSFQVCEFGGLVRLHSIKYVAGLVTGVTLFEHVSL
jgi:hypothetical protein